MKMKEEAGMRLLQKLSCDPLLANPLRKSLDSLANEEPAFAADEIVAASEDLINFCSALVYMSWLRKGKYKESLGAKILEIFFNKPYGNAVVNFFLALEILQQEDADDILKTLFEILTEGKDGERYGAAYIFELSALRNRITHGIFILPAKENISNTIRLSGFIADLVEKLPPFAIRDEKPYMGDVCLEPLFSAKEGRIILKERWNVFAADQKAAQTLKECDGFYTLYEKAYSEYTGEFFKQQIEKANAVTIKTVSKVFSKIYNEFKNIKGSFLVCGTKSCGKSKYWAEMVQVLQKEKYTVIAFDLHEAVMAYNRDVLARELYRRLAVNLSKKKKSSEDKAVSVLERNSKELAKHTEKTVILIDNIHIRQHHPEHIVQFLNTLYTLNIRVIGFSYAYPELREYFSQSKIYCNQVKEPATGDIERAVSAYVIDKGPDPAQSLQAKKAYLRLVEATKMIAELDKEEPLNLRAASEKKASYTLPLLQEAAAILAPWYLIRFKDFDEEEIDDIYEFPENPSEKTYPYELLGRRDIRMEYKRPELMTISSFAQELKTIGKGK